MGVDWDRPDWGGRVHKPITNDLGDHAKDSDETEEEE